MSTPQSEPPRLEIQATAGFTHARFPQQKLDGVAVRELYEAAVALTDQRHPRLLVDLDGVGMLTSGAVGILISIRKKYLQYGGQLHLARPNPLVMQSLEVMNVHRILRIFPTIEEAVTAFK